MPARNRTTGGLSDAAINVPMLLTHAEFRSDAFPPYESESEEVNPGRYGKRLAEYLALALNNQGEPVQDIYPDDWGWVIPIENTEFDLWVGVGNYDEYPDGFLCFIEPHREFVRKPPLLWKKISTTRRVAALQQHLDIALKRHGSVRGLRWRSHSEINQP